MERKEIKDKLDNVLRGFSIDTSAWSNYIAVLREKLEFVNDTNRYNKLLKNLFLSKEINEFNSYAFEASFAYDFESNSHALQYEINSLSDNATSIDFCYQFNDKKIYFELRVINPRNWITQLVKSMLNKFGVYEISLGGENERTEEARLQNLILSKCQNKKGKPIKFKRGDKSYNFIVVYVSGLHLTMIDKADCILAMYGDLGVSSVYRRNIFGLCQQMPENAPDWMRKYYDKFKHFRETIHGVLFVKNVAIRDPKYFVNLELEYFLIWNKNLMESKETGIINERLSSFLKSWTEKGGKGNSEQLYCPTFGS